MVISSEAIITSQASAFPGTLSQEELWRGFFADRYVKSRSARRAFSASGVEHRHAAVNPLVEDISTWLTSARMERYASEAMILGKQALSQALDDAGLSGSDIGFFVVASCTGYSTPGIDVLLARDLGMAREVKRLLIGHVGCHAALPALEAARDFVLVEKRPAMILCLELPSVHLQPPSDDLEQAVVHALFSDAASALIIEPPTRARAGFAVRDVAACTNPSTASYMGWNIGDYGFKMTLSKRVPDVLGDEVAPLVEQLLRKNDVARDLVDGWAIHPGGPRILDVVGERLGLDEDDLVHSRRVLKDHGNCSSPTVLLVLEEIARAAPVALGRYVIALAFGPGLTLYGALLQSQ